MIVQASFSARPVLLSIAAVERDTGLSKDTLRVWERRYGFPQPLRDANGERTYTAEQLARLRIVKRLDGEVELEVDAEALGGGAEVDAAPDAREANLIGGRLKLAGSLPSTACVNRQLQDCHRALSS